VLIVIVARRIQREYERASRQARATFQRRRSPAATYRETFKPTFPSWLAFKIRVERHARALAGACQPGDLPACHLAGYPGTSMPGHADTSA